MTALSIQPTYPIFTDIDGQPLDSGYVYIGQANLDPQGNPINVYWDAALTQLAAQPIRTLNGYPSNSGTPARLYVDSDYSIRVMNKKASTVYNAPTATERFSAVVVGGIDSSEVGYTPAGTGAVATTVQSKLQEVVSVKDFGAVGNGVVDDTAEIQAAFNHAATTGQAVVFPSGEYLCSNVSIPFWNDLAIIGQGQVTIKAIAAMSGDLWSYTPAALSSAVSVTANINTGDSTITVVHPAGAAIGDVVVIKSTATILGSVKKGIIGVITSLTGSSITINSPAEYSIATTDTPQALFYRPLNNPRIENIEFQLDGSINTNQGALRINYCLNARVNNCRAYANGSRSFGFSVVGFGGRVINCVAENFNDPTLTLGYGVAVAGHDMHVTGCQFVGNKHSITGGNNDFLSTDLLYTNNISRNTYRFAFDAHASCTRVTMRGNYVLDVGSDGGGFNVRQSGFTIDSNTVMAQPGVSVPYAAIQVIEGASDRIFIRNNDVVGRFGYGVKGNTSASQTYTNLEISGNTFDTLDASSNAVFFSSTKVTNAKVNGNKILGGVHGLYFASLENAILSDNYIEFGDLGIGFQASGDTSKTWQNVIVTDNVFKPISATSGHCIRVFGQSENWVVANNRQDTSVATKPLFTNSATAGYLTRVASTVSSTGSITVSGTAAPSAGTWARGDRVENSAPAVGSPKSWVCTVAGTPGTWVSEGNL